jgi:predicted ArsR family transcriptional regulator
MAIANQLGGTRPKILAILRREGSVTVDGLAREIGLSSTTIRRHLDILQRDQLVYFEPVREKSGRPAYVYTLTDDGQESGYRNYKEVLSLLLSEIAGLTATDLSHKDGEEMVSFLIGRVADLVSWPYLPPAASSNEARVAKLEQALTDRGYSPELTQTDGRLEIQLSNCPVRSVACDQDGVCLLDHKIIANILGVDPVQQSTIRGGHTSCLYVASMEN